MKLHKQNSVGVITSAKTRSPHGNANFLKMPKPFFESPEKHSDASSERIAQLEQLVGRLTLALEIQKKASTLLD